MMEMVIKNLKQARKMSEMFSSSLRMFFCELKLIFEAESERKTEQESLCARPITSYVTHM